MQRSNLFFFQIIKYYFINCRYVSNSRRELSGVKELVSSRRVQKNRHPSASLTRDGSTTGCGGAGLLGGCSGGNDALAELTIEDLAAIPTGNHGSSHHTGHPSHHKVTNQEISF